MLGVVWMLFNILIGLIGGLVGMFGGVMLCWSVWDCVVVFDYWLWGLGGVIILGNVILYIGYDFGICCWIYVY